MVGDRAAVCGRMFSTDRKPHVTKHVGDNRNFSPARHVDGRELINPTDCTVNRRYP